MTKPEKLYSALLKTIHKSGCNDGEVIVALSTLLRVSATVLESAQKDHLANQLQDVLTQMNGALPCSTN